MEQRERQQAATPATVDEARQKMRGVHDLLEGYIAEGSVARRDIQPNRAAFFFSALWELGDQERWPAYHQSMRRALEEQGLFAKPSNAVDAYFAFRDAVLTLRNDLGLSQWEFEHLCAYVPTGEGDTSRSQPPSADAQAPRVWLVSPGRNANKWEEFRREGILAVAFGVERDLRSFGSNEEIRELLRSRRPDDAAEPVQDSLALWEFAHAMKPGDQVFAKKGRTHIVGYGTVESAYQFEPERAEFRHVRKVSWRWSGQQHTGDTKLVTKTLTDVTAYQGLVAHLREAVGLGVESEAADPDVDPAAAAPEPVVPAYGVHEACADLFRTREEVEHLRDLTLVRKNVVLQGPPGVGKTYVARRLADLIVGRRDPENVCFVQFHQSYAYEDFVQGFRPIKDGGFDLRKGPFLQFCNRALQDPTDRYVLVIDEINRGNLSKIFGELFMLIEADKRDAAWAVTLAYSPDDAPFYVPANLHIIGTMNTADRSLAVVDYALRRRFAFVPLEPAVDRPAFEQFLRARGASADLVARIRSRVSKLNEIVRGDPDLGDGYAIGHSYFCPSSSDVTLDDAWYERVVRFELAPLLREYWFDRAEAATTAEELLLADD